MPAGSAAQGSETRRGLVVAPEPLRTPRPRRVPPYSQAVETCIIADMGDRVYGPYTGRYYACRREADIGHMVAASEAHDSGLCAADAAMKRRFAGRVVAVKRKYGLSVDAREVRALEGILTGCGSTEMAMAEGQAQVAEPTPSAAAPSTGDALSRWDTNGNGRITCREACEHGISPVGREHPSYWLMRDGVVCE